jgi:hypothetical protein
MELLEADHVTTSLPLVLTAAVLIPATTESQVDPGPGPGGVAPGRRRGTTLRGVGAQASFSYLVAEQPWRWRLRSRPPWERAS